LLQSSGDSLKESAWLIVTRLVYRGLPYFMEEEHEAFSAWWQLVHAPSRWLVYRGQKYRPCQIDKSGWM